MSSVISAMRAVADRYQEPSALEALRADPEAGGEKETLPPSTHPSIFEIAKEESPQPLQIPPKLKHFLLTVLELHNKIEESVHQHLDLLAEQNQRHTAELQKLSEELARAMKEFALEIESRNQWDSATNVFQYLISGAALIVGISLLNVPDAKLAGQLLIASGAVQLASRVGSDLGLWVAIGKWASKACETQKNIAQAIDIGLSIVSLGLGAVGGIIAYRTGAFDLAARANKDTILEKLQQIFSIGAGIGVAATRLGSAVVERKSNYTAARIKELEGAHFQTRQSFKQDTNQAKHSAEMIASLIKNLKSALAAADAHAGEI
jgi:hypothetical protein